MNASERDALTGLANRRGFDHAVRALIDDHPDLAFVLVYGDIDRFKVFNDRFGTEAGDRLLVDIGTRIAEALPTMSAAARLRADHFVCCLPRDEFDPERVLDMLDGWLEAYPIDFAFFVRLGVYDIDDPSLDVSLMTDRALMALRVTKAGARASRFARFDESMRDTVLKEQELVGEMAEALASGQFEPYFQPQFQFSTGALVGAEVLVRWNHPLKGLISPGEFISVFERNGIVSDLDYYIWAEACRCLRSWLDAAGPGNEQAVPRLSVNLSRADIYRDDLRAYLESLVEEYRIPFELLHLEITEGSYMKDPYQLANAVRQLQDAGFTVEMDDFGSGYSSLNALKDIPVDVLKLDLRFLDARNDTRGGVILASVVRMARWLDLPVIAEGVESESQALFLSSVGCDVMQGFLFSRPIDRASFEQLLARVECGRLPAGGMAYAREDFLQLWDAESLVGLVFNSYVGPAALAEYDGRQFEVVRSNNEFLTMLGLPLDRFASTVGELFGTLSERDLVAFDEAVVRATEEAGSGECELCICGRGDDFWVHASMRLLSRAGAVSSLLVTLDEVTEKQALRSRLQATMESMPGGIGFYLVENGEASLLDCNNTAASLVGMTRDEYIDVCKGDPLAHVVPEDRWIVETVVDELRSGASRAEGSVRALRVDGATCWLSLSVSPMYRRNDALYLVAVLLDVTKDKERDLRYRYLAEQERQLYEAVPCGIVRYFVGDELRIETANRAAWHMVGCESYEEFLNFVGDDVFRPLDDEGRDLLSDVTKRLVEGSPPVPFTCRIVRVDGEERLVEGVAALATTTNGASHVQCAFTDVTKQRREHHKRELQRFTSVLCSAYDEIFEYDVARATFELCYSAHRLVEDPRPFPLEEALERWFKHIPNLADHTAIRELVARCQRGPLDEPVSYTYQLETGAGRLVWNESTFMPVSEASVLCCNCDVTARMTAEDERLSERVSNIVENLPAGIGVYDFDDEGVHLRYVSSAVFELMHVEEDDVESIADATNAVTPEETEAFFAGMGENTLDFSVERELVRSEGPFMARVQGRIVRNGECSARVYAFTTDISDEVRERRERSWQNERYRILSELTHTISFDYNSESDTVLLYIDRTGNGMEAQVIPNYLKTLNETRANVVHPGSLDAVRAMFERARSGTKNEIIEYRADYYGTGYLWYRANLFVAHDDGGAWHLVGLIENIQSERELRLMAEHDAVTGLSNTASTRSLIEAALTDPHALTHSVCAVVDLDDFKSVNDAYGHLKGDDLLQRVGVVLQSNCRESDVVGRVGGDEFVVLLKNVGLDVATRKLATMKRAVASLVISDDDGVAIRSSISIGATATRVGDTTYRDVFSRADKALYLAKNAGKNRLRIV